jgi:predicted nucleotidyltransferase
MRASLRIEAESKPARRRTQGGENVTIGFPCPQQVELTYERPCAGDSQRLRRELEAHYGPRLVRVGLYGSQARNDASPDSDIDVLVVLRGAVHQAEEIERTVGIASELSMDFDQLVSCFFLAEEYFMRRNGAFLRNVKREGITV